MAKVTATVNNKQNRAADKKRFILLNHEGNIAATLIDRFLAEQWVKEHRKGAVKIAEV